ncbi:MAG: transposase [Gemmatimonadetes bacterium]|nr:transposase [Gemmatimonadota bacterium]
MIRALIETAVEAGARRGPACRLVGLSARTVERWRAAPEGEDARHGPHHRPANALTPVERRTILTTVTSAVYRDLSPHQIVPLLADTGRYLASESTLYRMLRAEALLQHRGRANAPERRGPRTHTATGPNQLWSWDITYLKTPVRGVFDYLYLLLDVWSRKIVGWAVHPAESAEEAAALFRATCLAQHADPRGIVLHADNGGPMKGATMVATLERLGVLASYSRPSVSNDNAYSESLFRTLKYCPAYPTHPFADRLAARAWVEGFVHWYNTQHLHSAIRFVTPEDRHAGRDTALLLARRAVYRRARARTPERWSGPVRNWAPMNAVQLNPDRGAVAAPARVA